CQIEKSSGGRRSQRGGAFSTPQISTMVTKWGVPNMGGRFQRPKSPQAHTMGRSQRGEAFFNAHTHASSPNYVKADVQNIFGAFSTPGSSLQGSLLLKAQTPLNPCINHA
ncbi:hypothetical protein PIB30_007025, partial [Stylosanthes scabra]|nr:hypothetical protein [Stylosanthes scabra]